MTIYYNRFNPLDNWFELLPIAGWRLQSAEIAEIQSMSIYRDRRIADVLFGTGHIIDGCQISINDAKDEADITKGSVYYDGMIYDIAGDSVVITGVGQEVIGLKVTYQIITHETVPDLKDPAIGLANYGLPGMDRRVAHLDWVLNDAAAFPVFRLQDGVVIMAAVPPELEGITPIVARRTYDTNGNFLVSGMDGFVEALDADNVNRVNEAGKAYVLGLEITKLIPAKSSVPKAKTTRQVLNETKTYHTGTDEYALNSTPVKQIIALTATVEITETVTRGNIPDTADLLPHVPVVSIVSVVQGATTFTPTTDYLLDGNSVDWSPAATQPAGGSSYDVTYRYTKTMVADTDYDQNENNARFLAGDRPVDGTTFQVTYDFYLGRRDVFYLDSEGNINETQGQPSVSPSVPPAPPNVLSLGEIYFPPNGDAADIVVTNYKPKRLTMLELRSMLDRVERSEYNAAIDELDREAQNSDPSITRKGILTDNFTNFEKADIYHALFDAMLDPDENELVLPANYEEHELAVDLVNTTAVLKGRLYMLPYTEEVVLTQTQATECMNINPYAVFDPIGVIALDPSEDVWVETVSVSTVVTIINHWWRWWWWRRGSDIATTTTKVLLDAEVQYIRERTVTVSGEGFSANADNIQATFDGVAVALTPVAPTIAGSTADTVQADANGEFTATFEIPSGVRCGTREVRLFNYV